MALLPIPYRSIEKPYFSGTGMVAPGLMPAADLKAIGVKWLRWILPTSAITTAYIDKILDYAGTNGFGLDWILPATVTAGAFDSFAGKAKQICARYVARGWTTPAFFELGNEIVQQHTAPILADFADEATAEIAYALAITAFLNEMNGYNFVCCAANEQPAVLLHCYNKVVAGGGAQPHLWGMHAYDDSANVRGTLALMAEVMSAGVQHTEGSWQYPGASRAQITTYFAALTSQRVAFCHYLGGDVSYDASSNPYGLFSASSTDGDGVATYTTRTQTLIDIAAAIGATLP